MKSKLSLLAMSAMLFLAIGLQSGCKDDGDDTPQPQQSVYEMLSASKYSAIKAAVDRAGLDAMLSSGTYTFFAPVNDAFLVSRTDPSTLSDTELAEFIKNHLVKGKFTTTELVNGNYLTSEAAMGPSGEKLSLGISSSTGSDRVNGSQVNSSTEATNGVLHEMSDVVEPATIYDQLLNNPDLETFKTAVALEVATKGELEAAGKFTVFSPKESAMTTYLNDKNVSISRLSPSDRRALVNNGIVNDQNYYAAELPNGTVPTRGEDLEVNTSGGVTLNGDVKVSTSDIQCTNGVLHIIDGTLTD